MKKFLFAATALSLVLGAASAQAAPGSRGGWGGNPDANQDGTLTRAEMTSAAETRFAKMDVNKDGKIDAADREARKAERFSKLDRDGNGEVSQAEMDAMKAERMAMRESRKAERFAMMDTDKSGGLSADEMAKGREGRGKWRGERGERGEHAEGGHHGKRDHHGGMRRGGKGRGMMGKAIDTDANGSISKAEFLAVATKRFDAQDSNKDGKVTPEERKAFRDARRGAVKGG